MNKYAKIVGHNYQKKKLKQIMQFVLFALAKKKNDLYPIMKSLNEPLEEYLKGWPCLKETKGCDSFGACDNCCEALLIKAGYSIAARHATELERERAKILIKGLTYVVDQKRLGRQSGFNNPTKEGFVLAFSGCIIRAEKTLEEYQKSIEDEK